MKIKKKDGYWLAEGVGPAGRRILAEGGTRPQAMKAWAAAWHNQSMQVETYHAR